MSFFSTKLGIDLGTANTKVFVPGKGVVLKEPSVVAMSEPERKILAVGEEAKNMVGKTPENIVAYRPMKDGVIADYRVTEAMLRYFIHKAMGRWNIWKPEVMLSVPAAIASTSVKCAGNRIDYAIADYLKKTYNLVIGDKMAEDIKIQIGSAIPLEEELEMTIKGRDFVTGLPRATQLKTNEVVKAIGRELREMIKAIKEVLQETPPELAADIIERGIIMTGGTSLLRN